MMPLEVIIATPSGPFGELIRLTLEADPTFRCTLLDRGEELWAALQTSAYQAVIYDCSCSLPEPREVSNILREKYLSTALFFIPSETDPDIENLLCLDADGTISRPFDASLLPEMIKAGVERRANRQAISSNVLSDVTGKSWTEILQSEIKGSAAEHGILIQNKAVLASTPEVSLSLQERILTDIMKYWNSTDTSDLMRFIKETESNIEWMIYATQVSDAIILVLLFEPKTPVTRVRILTVQVARQLAFRQTQMLPDLELEDMVAEFQNPPQLHEILGENPEDENVSQKEPAEFPVEWFKENDIPSFTAPNTDSLEPQAVNTSPSFNGEDIDTPEPKENSQIPSDMPFLNNDQREMNGFSPAQFAEVDNDEATPENTGYNDFLESDTFGLSSTPTLQPEIDLGSFQPVDLIAETPAAAGLDSFQPVDLSSTPVPAMRVEEATPEGNNIHQSASTPMSGSIEIPIFAEIEFPKIIPGNSGNSMENEILDPESGAIKIIKEPEASNSNDFISTVVVPEDLTDLPVYENLPYFHNPAAGEDNENFAKENPSDNMEAALSPFGLEEFQPGGEPAMKNIDEHDVNNLSDDHDVEPAPSGSSGSQSPDDKSNLFSRMNQLQNSTIIDGTETITVALIPLKESFILQRQIAGILNQCMIRLGQAFGWTLNEVTIRPTYMQWTVTIPNLFTPEDMTAIVRKQTSQTLFESLPDLQLQMDGDDIWAPESMMASGKDFVPSPHWQNFILRRKNDEIA